MKIKNKQVTTMILVSGIIANLLSGCKKEEIEVSIDSAPKKSKEIMEHHFLNDQIKTDNFDTEIVYSNEDILDKLEEYYHQCGIPYLDILTKSKDKTINNELYIAALYMKLKDLGYYTKDTIISELERIYLDITLPNQEGTVFFNYYYPLASFVHQHSCDANHKLEEYDVLSCDKINEVSETKALKDKIEYCLTTAPFKEFISVYNRFKYKPNFNDYLYELETLYAFGSIPTDYHDEEIWNYYFLNLNSTLIGRENLYDVYYKFAIFVHKLNCEYEHKRNEYGATTCNEVKLIFDSRSYPN